MTSGVFEYARFNDVHGGVFVSIIFIKLCLNNIIECPQADSCASPKTSYSDSRNVTSMSISYHIHYLVFKSKQWFS